MIRPLAMPWPRWSPSRRRWTISTRRPTIGGRWLCTCCSSRSRHRYGRPAVKVEVQLTVNGQPVQVWVEPRKTLVDVLRDDLGLTGTHVGCEHGVCGACNVLVDGRSARSCLLFAVQAAGHEVVTIEGLTPPDGALSPVQEAFRAEHGLQCGFCTPGVVVTVTELLASGLPP